MSDLLPAIPEALDLVEDPGAVMVALVDQARALLAQAKGMEGLAVTLEIKSRAEAIRVYTQQKDMGREAELSAAEIVRRAERRIGELIREGQAAGEIGDRASSAGARWRSPSELQSPKEFFSSGSTQSETYAMTDDVSPGAFERAITNAKEEGNLSRANVIRHVTALKNGTQVAPLDEPAFQSREAIEARRQRIREMAGTGARASQIGAEIGLSDEHVRKLAREMGVEIVAEKVVGKTRRIDPNRVVNEAVIALEAAVMGLDLVEMDALDTDQVDGWVTSFNNSLRSLNRFAKQLKEMTR